MLFTGDMMKRKKRLPPLNDNPAFQELLRALRKQTPDQLERLQTLLDERIRRSNDAANGTESADNQTTKDR